MDCDPCTYKQRRNASPDYIEARSQFVALYGYEIRLKHFTNNRDDG